MSRRAECNPHWVVPLAWNFRIPLHRTGRDSHARSAEASQQGCGHEPRQGCCHRGLSPEVWGFSQGPRPLVRNVRPLRHVRNVVRFLRGTGRRFSMVKYFYRNYSYIFIENYSYTIYIIYRYHTYTISVTLSVSYAVLGEVFFNKIIV